MPNIESSALPALMTAIETEINAIEGPIVAYHEGSVPEEAELPYAIVGSATEPYTTERGITEPGREQTILIRFWAAEFSEAMSLFSAAMARLNGKLLGLGLGSGHQMLWSRLSYLSDFPEPDPEIDAHGVIAEYRTRTKIVEVAA